MTARRVLLLRHGETDLNRSGALRGRLEVGLSPHGRWQACQLASRIVSSYRLEALYASPLRRARETAQPIASAMGMTIAIEERFTDIDYGAWAGKLVERFTPEERSEYRRWCRSPDVQLTGAEDPTGAQRRALAALAECAERHGGPIAVVAHDAILQLILCAALGLHIGNYRGIAQHTATLNEIAQRPTGWRVDLLNSAWHLDGDSSA